MAKNTRIGHDLDLLNENENECFVFTHTHTHTHTKEKCAFTYSTGFAAVVVVARIVSRQIRWGRAACE